MTILGRFVWHELMTTDTRSAGAFFTKVIGWKAQAWSEDKSYTVFLSRKQPVAGLMALGGEAAAMGTPPSWLTYIGTPNVDETAKRSEALGARILKPPTEVATVGRFAVLQDPQGAVFAAYTPARETATDARPGVGDFSWHELPTTDSAAAVQFYKDLFGWEEISTMDMGPEMGPYRMYGWNGTTRGGIFNKPKDSPGPPAWLAYIRVGDSKRTATTVKKLGGQIINGPMEVPGGDWIAVGTDLQGAVFAVHSLKAVASKKPAETRKAKRAAAKSPARKRTASGAKKRSRKAASSKAKAASKLSMAKTSKGKTGKKKRR
jgi:predicted enzyme related to lactoylglutathione lyase